MNLKKSASQMLILHGAGLQIPLNGVRNEGLGASFNGE